MRLKDKKYSPAENEALASRLSRRKFRKVFITVICVLLALVLALGGAAYAAGAWIFGNMYHETMDTSVKNLGALREIIEREGDYTGSDYTPAEIAEVKYGIILDGADMLLSVYKDYDPLCDALEADPSLTAADGYTEEEIAFVAKAIRFGCVSVVRNYEYIETAPGTEPPVTGPSESGSDTAVPGTDTDVPGNNVVVDTPETEPPRVSGVTVTDADVYNVLLLGVDSRQNNFADRTDTIMVVSINKATKRVVLTSFLRDLKVFDPTLNTWTKINNIYARGYSGAGSIGTAVGRLAVALKYNFEITIHNYAIVNFSVFEKVVDVFGGVDVPLYYGEYNYMYWHTYGDDQIKGLDDYYLGGNEKGYIYVHLNASQALVYARMRSNVYNPATGEYERSSDRFRTERQKYVVWSLIRQLRSLDIDKITQIAEEVMPMVATDLTYNDFLGKLMGYLDYNKYSISTFSIPVDKSWIYGEGSYVEIFDFDANRKKWRNEVYS